MGWVTGGKCGLRWYNEDAAAEAAAAAASEFPLTRDSSSSNVNGLSNDTMRTQFLILDAWRRKLMSSPNYKDERRLM